MKHRTAKQNKRIGGAGPRTRHKTLGDRLRTAAVEADRRERRTAEKDERHAQALGRAEEATRVAKLDADEVRHRLKNTIAVIQAIANATFRDGTPIQKARAAFGARLAALSVAHDILFNVGWSKASVPAIIRGVLAPYQSSHIRSRGPDVAIDPKQALAFALALHELASNASKYGALSAPRGHVDIVWKAKPVPKGKELQLRWHEYDGPAVETPVGEGFGTRLIKHHLAAEFNGSVKLDYKKSGVVCTLVAPLH